MKSLSIKKEAEITRRLHHLLLSGQGILDSIILLERPYPCLKSISISLKQGKSLATSIKNMPIHLSPLTQKMIELGEATGTLSSCLLKLSHHLRHVYEIRSQIINACIYPIIIIILSFSMMGFLLLYIFPKILPIFSELNIPLPFTTRILTSISHFFSSYFIYDVLCAILTIFALIYFRKKILQLPGIRNIGRSIFLVSFFRSLGIMLQSDVGVLNALFLIGENENDQKNKKIIMEMMDHIKRGRSISSYLKENASFFGHNPHQFVVVGEQTGTLSNSCVYFSEYLEHDLLSILNKIARLFEPGMMILVGAGVGLMALSIISPLYELSRISSI